MALTKVSYAMINGKVVNVFDYMTAAEIAATTDPDNTTDVTAAIEAAIAACKSNDLGVGNTLYFPTGTFCFSETTPNFGIYTNQTIRIQGSGMQKTVLKNLSATGAGLRTAGGTCVSVQDLTIDMNGSSGVGFYQAGQYSVTRNLEVINQAVGSLNFAVIVSGSSAAVLENIFLSLVSNGIQIGPTPTNYVDLNHIIIGPTSGVGVYCSLASNCRFNGLTIEPDATVSAGHGRMMNIQSCSQMDFRDVTWEDSADSTMSAAEYILVEGSKSINFDNCRINHHGQGGRAFFHVGTNTQGVSVTNSLFLNDQVSAATYWIEVSGATAPYNVNVENIITNTNATNVGVQLDASYQTTVKNWTDTNGLCQNYIYSNAHNVLMQNCGNDSEIDSTNNVILMNCPGAITGTAAVANAVSNLDYLVVSSNETMTRPLQDNTQALGYSSYRWTQVYAVNGTINTSDEREKTDIDYLSVEEKAVATKLKNSIKKFKFKAAVDKKGNEARIHTGVVAQEVKAAFESEGLDPYHYGIFCYDEWDDVYEEEAEIKTLEDGTTERVLTGNKILVKKGGNRFGIRYDELLAFIIGAL